MRATHCLNRGFFRIISPEDQKPEFQFSISSKTAMLACHLSL